MDWSHCPDVERAAEKVSGAWVVKGTRVPVEAILDNARDGFPPKAIARMFEGVAVDQVRGVLRFAEQHVTHSA